MNRIELRTVRGAQSEEIRFLLDGIDLFERVRSVELGFAEREGHASIAGAYAGLPAQLALPPSRHLFGEDAILGFEDGIVPLGICDCGEPGCWPLLAKVTVEDSRVTWSDFHQPHRDEDAAAGHWTYESFGPFVFDREQYERALIR
jgi:hypothetical protein